MEKEAIETCLAQLDTRLGKMGIKGEICLYGGAVMCLGFQARPSTKDVDAVFEPAEKIREAARLVAQDNDLREDWLNDAVKGFVVSHPKKILMDLPHLKVFIPEADYLLAMKALSARVDGTDRSDVEFLIARMGLKKPGEVFAVLQKYYPRERIKPATQFFIEELFQNGDTAGH